METLKNIHISFTYSGTILWRPYYVPDTGSATLELLLCAKHIGIFSSRSGGGHRIQKWKETSPPTPQGKRIGVSSWAESSSLHLGASWHVPLRVLFFFFPKLSAVNDGSPATKSLVRLLSVDNTPATHQQFLLWCLLAHPQVVVKLIF